MWVEGAAPEFDFEEELVLVLEEWEALSGAVDMVAAFGDEEEAKRAEVAARRIRQHLEGEASFSNSILKSDMEVLQKAIEKLRSAF